MRLNKLTPIHTNKYTKTRRSTLTIQFQTLLAKQKAAHQNQTMSTE